jgi:hypothetical protein
MSVQLLAIALNHDPTSANADALNIRRNATTFVNVPEWQRGVSVNPEDAPAAYALAQVHGQAVTIKAQFRTTTPLGSVKIRALDTDLKPPGGTGCLGLILQLLYWLFRALFGNVLGEPAARTVTFGAGGVSGLESFTLKHTRLDTAQVGVYTTRWRWQYRKKKGGWHDFDTSAHRVYLVLDTPAGPWQQAPYNAANTQLPWTEVLDYACAWADLATTADDAAAKVTAAVYDLGPGTVTYDCPGGGGSHYSGGVFNCTAFLDRLRGGAGNGQYVNCSDCATFVSSFANAVGCNLVQGQMGYGFQLNPLLAIGYSVWQTACGWGGFSYHEVAWDTVGVNGNVWDACLQVDGDADPTTAPHTPLLPVKLGFGNPGDMMYRERLSPGGSCDAQPGTAQRRSLV